MRGIEPPESTYGSDRNGLVWAYVFSRGHAGRAIEAADVVSYLGASAAPNTFVWLHFAVSNVASERFMREHLSLPELYYELMKEGAGSTRLEQDESRLVAQLHDVLFAARLDDSSASSVSVCLEPRLLVTARRRPLRSIDRLRAAVKAEQRFRTSTDLLGQLLREQAGVLADVVRDVSTRIDTIEDQLLSERVTATRRELGQLRRTLVRLQRLLAPEPAALFRLLNRPPSWIAEDDLQDLRQAAEEFSVSVGDASSVVERLKLIQEELGALVNEQTGRTLFTLTILTVLALPINLAAGLFGMNVGGIPLAESAHGFAIVVATLAGVTGVIVWVYSRRPRD